MIIETATLRPGDMMIRSSAVTGPDFIIARQGTTVVIFSPAWKNCPLRTMNIESYHRMYGVKAFFRNTQDADK